MPYNVLHLTVDQFKHTRREGVPEDAAHAEARQDTLAPIPPARDHELAARKEQTSAVGRFYPDGDGRKPVPVIEAEREQARERSQVDGHGRGNERGADNVVDGGGGADAVVLRHTVHYRGIVWGIAELRATPIGKKSLALPTRRRRGAQRHVLALLHPKNHPLLPDPLHA